MAAAAAAADWSSLPADLLLEILNLLDLDDFIHLGAVCTSWRHTQTKFKFHDRRYSSKTYVPWLLLSSHHKPDSRFFYSLTNHNKYEIHLPSISGFRFVGSCNGFLFAIDKLAQIHAFNPLTGAEFPLPPPTGHSNIAGVILDGSFTGKITEYVANKINDDIFDLEYMQNYYHKAIISPALDAVVVIHDLGLKDLAFARSGDATWTELHVPACVNDVIFHKGRLHAIDHEGTLFILNDDLDHVNIDSCSDDLWFISPRGPSRHRTCGARRFLVESPDGEDLFFIHKVFNDEYDHQSVDPRRTTSFQVYKLIKKSSNLRWKKVKRSMGMFAVFVGFNYTMSFSVSDFPSLESNAIYVTDDYCELYELEPEPNVAVGFQGIFSIGDGRIRSLNSTNDHFQQFRQPPPIWFSPKLS